MTTFKFRDEFRARQGINTESNLTTDLVTNALLVKCTFIGHGSQLQDWGQILLP